VGTALTNSGFKYPMRRVKIDLAPARVKKEDPSFDLPRQNPKNLVAR
jgi:predicted ATPase with chaperone activity